MTLIALSMLIAAATPAPKPPVAERLATVSVQIVAAEEIRFETSGSQERRGTRTTRQQRTRDGMAMIEFY